MECTSLCGGGQGRCRGGGGIDRRSQPASQRLGGWRRLHTHELCAPQPEWGAVGVLWSLRFIWRLVAHALTCARRAHDSTCLRPAAVYPTLLPWSGYALAALSASRAHTQMSTTRTTRGTLASRSSRMPSGTRSAAHGQARSRRSPSGRPRRASPSWTSRRASLQRWIRMATGRSATTRALMCSGVRRRAVWNARVPVI